ncbi:MAG TPA: serine hydrolase [Duganella sp.]|nr:serine hydrolase [Duganella sp.]
MVEVIRDGKVVLAKGYGSVDLERMMSLKAARPDEVVTLEDGLALLKRQRALNFTPGQQFLYSNSGYLLLEQIVQRVSGLPLAEFARVHIFQPLGMKHTQFLQFNRVNLSPAKTR